MTTQEADNSFTQQSVALTNHKNHISNRDRWQLFRSNQTVYRRIRTRADHFIVRSETGPYIHNKQNYYISGQEIKSINIKKKIIPVVREHTLQNIFEDLSRIYSFAIPDQHWISYSICIQLARQLDEITIIDLLETTIFTTYREDDHTITLEI
jgi:hypothetical protein